MRTSLETSGRLPHDGVNDSSNESDLELVSLNKNLVWTSTRKSFGGERKLWQPLIVSRSVLSGLLILFCLCLIGLVILGSLSTSRNGLVAIAIASQSQQYLWTYLPTAIFTLLAVAWNQVDYRAKQMMPWIVMQQTAQTTAESLRLDYITPLNVLTLYRAGRAKHWLTASAVVGTFALQLSIIFSTGLFSSRSSTTTLISSNGTLQTIFDPAGYKDGVNLTYNDHEEKYEYHSENTKPWASYFSTLNLGMDYPNGTTDNYTFQQWSYDSTQQAFVTASVDVFFADLTCESAQLVDASGTKGDLNISSSGCSQISFHMAYYQLDRAEIMAVADRCKDHDTGEDAMRLAFLAGDFDNNIYYLNDTSNYTAIICQPSYQLREGMISYNFSGGQGLVPELTLISSASRQFDNLTAWDVAKPWLPTYCSIDSTPGCLRVVGGITQRYQAVLNSSYPQEQASSFKDEDVLIEAAKRSFRSWTAQMAGLHLAKPINQSLSVNATLVETRLHAQGPSVWLSEIALGCLVLACVCVVWQSPKVVMTRDPSSIGGMAEIMAADCTIRDAVARHESFLREDLITISSSAVAHAEDPTASGGERSGSLAFTFYAPFIVSRFAMAIVILAPISTIVALEISWRYSNSHQGLVDAPDHVYSQYAWRYVPALVTTSISLLFGSLTSVIKSFQPFHAFHQGQASMQTGLFDCYLGQTAVQALWTASVQHQWATSAVALSSLVAPFLTIFVSGLFNDRSAESVLNGSIRQIDQFNKSVGMGDAASSSGSRPWLLNFNLLMEDANTSFPVGTYSNLVLPRLDAQLSDWELGRYANNLTGTRINAVIPVLRANVNCTAWKAHDILNMTYSIGTSGPVMDFSAVPPQLDCNVTGGYTESAWPFTGDMVTIPNYRLDGQFPQYDGYWDDVMLYGMFRQTRPGDVIKTYSDLRPGCPTAITYFASMSDNHTSSKTAFYCSPFVEQLNVNATLIVPELTPDYENPPVPDESTATFFSNASVAGLASAFLPMGPYNYGSFYDLLLYGRNAVDPSDLVGEDNQDNLLAAINLLWGQLVANYMNYQRIPFTAGGDAPLYNATMLHANRSRLMQDRTSTRALQSILALMALCAIVAFATMDTRHILPVNPNSVAAVASLLSGADMLDRRIIPEGSEWLNDKESKARGVFEGYYFSLGWWSGADGEKRRFGIDIGQAEKVGR